MHVPYEIMASRVEASNRPLKGTLHRLYMQRKSHYAEVGQELSLGNANKEIALERLCEAINAA